MKYIGEIIVCCILGMLATAVIVPIYFYYPH